MAKIKIDFSDLRKLEKSIRNSAKISQNERQKAVANAVTLVHRESVNNTKAGVLYSDGVYETGNLRRGLTFQMLGKYAGQVGVNASVDYARFVEFGTRKQRKKPYLFPAYEKNKDKITKMFKDVLEKVKKGIIKL